MPAREPYAHVKRILKEEVGFCCPVKDCGSPYLTWHHFDPPWRVEEHHRPEGMIALCRPHADKADHGSFTDDQLRELKRIGKSRAQQVVGRFDWKRRDLLAVVGGIFYYKVDTIIQIGITRCVWFNRDEDGYLRLNFRMPTTSGHPRAVIEDDCWSVVPDVKEVTSPPHGRLLDVRCQNGDRFRAEFREVKSPAAMANRYSHAAVERFVHRLTYPITVVDLWQTAPGTDIDLTPRGTKWPTGRISGGFMAGCQTGMYFAPNGKTESDLFPDGK